MRLVLGKLHYSYSCANLFTLVDFVYDLEKNDNLIIELVNMNYAIQQLGSIDNTGLNETSKCNEV